MYKPMKWMERFKQGSNARLPLLLFVAGLLLVLLTGRSGKAADVSPEPETLTPQQEAEAAEQRLAELLAQIDGVGQVRVLLSYSTSAETEYVSDDGETVIVSSGSGKQTAVSRRTIYPRYLGAVVVCEGGASATVRLDVLRAVSQFTGLGADHITVLKLRNH